MFHHQVVKLISPNFSDIYTPGVGMGRFRDGDCHVRIPNITACRGRDVAIFHRLYPNQNSSLIELLLMLDALKYEAAKSITVVSPYLPYARQDKQTVDGEIASAHVICNLLARNGASRFVTFDCHFLNEEGEVTYGELKIHNISLRNELIAHARKLFAGQPFEVIGPDDGAAYLVSGSGGKNFKKARQAYTDDKVAYRDIETMKGDFDLGEKNVLLLDDMISSGSTMIKALENVVAAGAKKIICSAAHGLFLYNCLDRLRKRADAVYASDSIISGQAAVSIRNKIDELYAPMEKLL